MESRVFLDSNIFIALINKDDSLHERTVKLFERLKDENLSPVTSNFVVGEVITVLSQRVAKKEALMFSDFIYNEGSNMELVTIDKDLEIKALSFLKNSKSKNISFCDCTTLALLEDFKINKIATFDKDFKIKNSKFKVVC